MAAAATWEILVPDAANELWSFHCRTGQGTSLLTRSTVRRSDCVSAANLQPTAPRFPSPLRLPGSRAADASPLARRALKGQGQLIRDLQAAVGNAAVRLILQRKGGWPDASSKGRKWNDPDPKKVRPDSKVWRIAIAGLKGGTAGRFKGG